jgi:perosamine synthetase
LPDTWCIDPQKVREAVTPKTRAIIPVHIYGNLAEMDEIMAIAREFGLVVLEDAAEGLGSEYRGQKAGSIGDAGVFSFHGTKTMSTGEGGIIVTNRDDVYQRAKVLNDHGRDPRVGKTFWMEEYGYKYKMSNLQAAMGCAQVERAEELVEKKRLIFSWYKELLSGLPCQLNAEHAYTKNSYWMPTAIFDKSIPFDREAFFSWLKKYNIDSRPFFYPLTSLPMFTPKPENTVAYDIYNRGVNLPSHHDLGRADIEYVCSVINKFIHEN